MLAVGGFVVLEVKVSAWRPSVPLMGRSVRATIGCPCANFMSEGVFEVKEKSMLGSMASVMLITVMPATITEAQVALALGAF